VLYNDRSGNALFLFMNVAGEDYSNCNLWRSIASLSNVKKQDKPKKKAGDYTARNVGFLIIMNLQGIFSKHGWN
jgi:hypothetical protein